MNRLLIAMAMTVGVGGATAWASSAATTADAQSGWGGRSGSAAATAEYDGKIGLAVTRSRSGAVSAAQGVSLGVDREGATLSVSHAVATREGPAHAGTLNISVDRDGDVSVSHGGVTAEGGQARRVEAGGTAATHGRGAEAVASGRTWGGGRVEARTHTSSDRRIPVRLASVRWLVEHARD